MIPVGKHNVMLILVVLEKVGAEGINREIVLVHVALRPLWPVRKDVAPGSCTLPLRAPQASKLQLANLGQCGG